MLRQMTQALANGALRRRHTNTAPALLPAPEPPRDDDTAWSPTYPSPAVPPPLAPQAWAAPLIVPVQPEQRVNLDPYSRRIPQPSRGYQA